jgi:hypothetical protein
VKRLIAAIVRWYGGEHVPPENDPNSAVMFAMGHQQYHWSARLARRLVQFYLENWKWLWAPVFAGIIALLVRK